MKRDRNVERFYEAIDVVSERIKTVLFCMDPSIQGTVQEIRLRAGLPVMLYSSNDSYFISRKGTTVKDDCNEKLLASEQDILDTFQRACSYSFYSHQEEIQNGYVTIRGGHRVGICGTAVVEKQLVKSVRNISSLNIRVAREMFGIARHIMPYLDHGKTGTLIVGPPLCGKTTLLREIARCLSNGDMGDFKRVVVIDERGELAGSYKGVRQNDLGYADLFDGYPKGEGIVQAIRSLGPEIIICDEIGTERDVLSVQQGLNAGVSIIATFHASSIEELLRRKQAVSLLNTRAFARIVLLKGRESPGAIEDVIGVETLYDQDHWYSCSGFRRGLRRSYSFL